MIRIRKLHLRVPPISTREGGKGHKLRGCAWLLLAKTPPFSIENSLEVQQKEGAWTKKEKKIQKEFFKKGFTNKMMLCDNVHRHLEFLCMYTKK